MIIWILSISISQNKLIKKYDDLSQYIGFTEKIYKNIINIILVQAI